MGFFAKLFGLTRKKMPTSVDDESFSKVVLQSEIPVILDIWGPNCAPCKQMEPVLMQLAGEYDGRVKICELAAPKGPRTCARYGVRGTPTILYFKKGREVERVVGFRSSLYHEQAIEELFGIPKEPEE